jgi:chorismate synthase
MTNTVTDFSSLIDITFPVAGQANDTQGFRDNFSAIKNAFTATSNSLANLQIQINTIASTSSVFASTVAATVTNTVLANITATLTATVISINSSTGVSTYSKYPVNSSKGQVGDKKGMIYATGNYIYMCYADYTTGSADIWARVQTTSTGLTSWP